VNKLAVHHIPLPGLVTACQFASCTFFVYGGKLGGCLHMDNFEWSKAKYFIIYVISFTIGTYTNMKVLSMANVETVIGAPHAHSHWQTLPRILTVRHAPYAHHHHCVLQYLGHAHQSQLQALTTCSTTVRSLQYARAWRCCLLPPALACTL
jgi:hypothetical protein